MFELPVLQASLKVRAGVAQFLAEFVATAGLLATILGCVRFATERVAAAVGCYIAAAYWFTASTSFANPAVTVARSLSNTFAGIQPVDLLHSSVRSCSALWPLGRLPLARARASSRPRSRFRLFMSDDGAGKRRRFCAAGAYRFGGSNTRSTT